ncbi:hypothetical protein [Piscibacillus salipiscarius]|uniref:hypothetical protein n=1 Tax=Piscibacillus salipiscarius TaxID=299480 RepID=UPI0006D1AB19|nr:hypothetical protein [Piscibacillus salipiscarius]
MKDINVLDTVSINEIIAKTLKTFFDYDCEVEVDCMYNFIDNSIKYYPYTTYEYHKGDTILYTINPISLEESIDALEGLFNLVTPIIFDSKLLSDEDEWREYSQEEKNIICRILQRP